MLLGNRKWVLGNTITDDRVPLGITLVAPDIMYKGGLFMHHSCCVHFAGGGESGKREQYKDKETQAHFTQERSKTEVGILWLEQQGKEIQNHP